MKISPAFSLHPLRKSLIVFQLFGSTKINEIRLNLVHLELIRRRIMRHLLSGQLKHKTNLVTMTGILLKKT